MAEPLRHRQTKEAATDMFSLQPPRHIPTLPFAKLFFDVLASGGGLHAIGGRCSSPCLAGAFQPHGAGVALAGGNGPRRADPSQKIELTPVSAARLARSAVAL